MKENKFKVAILAVFSLFIVLILAIVIYFVALNGGDFSKKDAIKYSAGATSIENGLTTDEVSFTADGVTTENGEDIYLTYTVDYKTVPRERLNDVIPVEYRRTMYVPRNSVGDYDISATLSYTDLSVNAEREIKYSGADTEMISYSVAGDFIAFCYPLPEGDIQNLKLTLKIHFVTTAPDSGYDTMNTFMHQSGGVFNFANVVPGGSQGADYVTSPFFNDASFSMYLVVNRGADGV